MITQNNIGIGVDVEQMMRVMSSSMYSNDMIHVSCKELAQNGFDACKKKPNARVELFCNSRERYVKCVDNGVGMSSQTVKDVYLSIGGTLKDHLDVEERSGGFGIAKVQFFVAADSIEVDTWHNGEHTILKATKRELFTGTAKMQIEYGIHPDGSSVTLYYPEKVKKLDGSVVSVNYPYWTPDFLTYPNPGYEHVEVYFNGSKVNRSIQDFLGGKILTAEWDFDTMHVKAYYRLDGNMKYSYSPIVFSAGLYQFDYRVRVEGSYKEFKVPTILDIRSKVLAGEEGYPFNNQREGFRPGVMQYVDTISKYLFDIQYCIESENLKQKYSKLDSLEYFKVDGTALEESVKPVDYSEDFVQMMNDAFQHCLSTYQEPQIVKESRIRMDANLEKQMKSEHLKFLNDTKGNYANGYKLFCAVSSVLLDALEKCPDDMKEQEKFPKVVGVHISKEMHGHLLTLGGVSGLFINPLSSDYPENLDAWIIHMWDTFTHELTHVYVSDHYDYFCSKQAQIEQVLAHEGVRLFLYERLTTIWYENCREIGSLSQEYRQC